MMSNILEKTFASIFPSGDPYSGLQGFFKQCVEVKTKKEEAMKIQQYLSLLRERLKQPGLRPNFVGHCLAFVMFCDLLGYPAEFAHIQAINLAQKTSIPEKKMGYAASCCLLREGHDLCLLLVNTLVRDLTSSNVVVIDLALSALCSAPLPPDATPTLLPAVRDRLAHPTAYVRCRAVVAAHHLLKKHPDQSSHIVGSLIARLGDEDPHVVARVLAVLPDIIQVSPESVAGLITPLVAIQRQILGGKLPPDMVYRGLQAPWAQLAIIKVLPELALGEEEEGAAREVLGETLTQASIREGAVYEPLIRAALVSQSVAALMSLEESTEASKIRALQHVTTMLASSSNDVKHEGLQLLGLVLARHEATLTPEQRAAVTSSLEHADVSVRRRALALLATGAGPGEVQQVCGQLFTHAAAADPHLRGWLLEQAMVLLARFPDATSSDWRLSALIKLLPLAEEPQLVSQMLDSCQQLLLSGDVREETRSKLLAVLSQHAEARQAPTCLLRLYVWTLGRFPKLAQAGGAEEEGQDAINRLVTLGSKIHGNYKAGDASLLLSVVHNCTEALERSDLDPSSEQLISFLHQVRGVDPDLEEACGELLNSLPLMARLRDSLSRPAPAVDCTLACLDKFVSQRLAEGSCRPYRPHLAAAVLHRRAKSPEVVRSPPPASLPLATPQAPAPSGPSRSQGSNPASEDSWSARRVSSPVEAASPEGLPVLMVWGRGGRVSTPEPPRDTSASSLAMALTGEPQVSRASSVEAEVESDPLGDLLR